MLIVVSGWRLHPDRSAITRVMARYAYTSGIANERLRIMSGHCPTGADRIVEDWATRRGITLMLRPAEDYGAWPFCGPRRNQAMIDAAAAVRAAGESVTVVAFPQPNWATALRCGTRDLITRARRAGFTPDIHIAPEHADG